MRDEYSRDQIASRAHCHQLMLAVSLWMAWSVWRVVRRLVAYVGDHMDGLIRKQGEVLQEVASVATAEAESKRIEQPPETDTCG